MYYVEFVFGPEVAIANFCAPLFEQEARKLYEEADFYCCWPEDPIANRAIHFTFVRRDGSWRLRSNNGFQPNTKLSILDPRSPEFLRWYDAEVKQLVQLIEVRIKNQNLKGYPAKLGHHSACTLTYEDEQE